MWWTFIAVALPVVTTLASKRMNAIAASSDGNVDHVEPGHLESATDLHEGTTWVSMYHVGVAQDERKPTPTPAELIAELKNAAAARKQQYKESQAPPPARPEPSQDVPGPDAGNRGW